MKHVFRYFPISCSVSVLSFTLFERHFKLLCLNFGNLAVLVNLIPVLSFLDFSKPVIEEISIIVPFWKKQTPGRQVNVVIGAVVLNQTKTLRRFKIYVIPFFSNHSTANFYYILFISLTHNCMLIIETESVVPFRTE